MTIKEEALKLADELDEASKLESDLNRPENEADFQKASAMIRRLVEELEELKHDNEELLKCLTAERKQGEPVEDYSGETDDGVKFVGELPDGHPLKYPTPQTKPFPWGDVSNEKLIQEVRDRGYKIKNAEIQTKPLSDEEIDECKAKAIEQFKQLVTPQAIEQQMLIIDRLFARAIEKAHGIQNSVE